MARIFTTKFTFNHQYYDAIVTVISKDSGLSFQVKVMDLELYDLLPQGTINYEGKDGFKDMNEMDNQLSQSLMKSIATAIESHLVSMP